jgi:ferredoxin-type protein NapH
MTQTPTVTPSDQRPAGPRREPEPSVGKKLLAPAMMFVVFWTLAIVMWRTSGQIFYLANFGYIGTSIASGWALYAVLPRKRKQIGRKLALFLVGGYMLGFLGLLAHENMQIEGFFFYLLAGFWAGAVIHYAVAKVFGPMLFGRGWCGWTCWTVMVLDLLPYRTSPGRVRGRWGLLRYAHFALSLGLVLVMWFAFGYRVAIRDRLPELYWLLGGNALYYAVGIGLAFALRDNRAFCKYVCPITTLLKLTSRFSLLKVRGNADTCIACGACAKQCPMDIRIPEYVKAGWRVLSTECVLCQSCIHVCPTRTLSLSFGFDLGGRELLRERKVGPSGGG